MSNHSLAPPRLTAEQARALTDEAKSDATMLWAKLYALYEGDAHIVLCYTDWGEYIHAEFGWSPGQGSRLLQAGRVRATLERKLPIGSLPETEAVARELHPVPSKAPDQLEAVWDEAVATAEGDAPTAAEVRAVVDRRAEHVRPRPRAKQKGQKPHRRTSAERRRDDAVELTAMLRGVLADIRKATTKMRDGQIVRTATSNERAPWMSLTYKIEQEAPMLRAMLHRQLEELGEQWRKDRGEDT